MPRLEYITRPAAQKRYGRSDEWFRRNEALLTVYRPRGKGPGKPVHYDTAELDLLIEGRLAELANVVAAKRTEAKRRTKVRA